MTPKKFLSHFGMLADAPNGVAKLRELILQLAVRGKLVRQNPDDEPADRLLGRISARRNSLIAKGEFSSPKNSERSTTAPIPLPGLRGWRRVVVGDVIVLVSGQHLLPEAQNSLGNGLPYLTGPADFGVTHPVATRWTTQAKATALRQDILVTVKGAGVGKANILDMDEAAIGRQLMAARPILVHHRFLYLFTQASYERLQKLSIGSTVPGIGRNDILHLVFDLPPIPEQRRIVAKVDELMALCDALEAQRAKRAAVRAEASASAIDKLLSARDDAALAKHWTRLRDHFDRLYDTPKTVAQLRQAILQLAVLGKLVPQNPKDEPAAVLLRRIETKRQQLMAAGDLKKTKAVPIGNDEVDGLAASHWSWARLEDLVYVMNSGWSPACQAGPTRDESEWGVLKTTSVQSFRFWEHEHKRLPDSLEARPEAEAKPGDLLITRAGPKNRVGISCLIRQVRPRLMISDKIVRFHLIEPFMYDEFVALCLNAGVSQSHIENAKSGMAASQMNISQAKLRMTPIPIPPYAEQKRIVAKVGRLLALCDALEEKLTRAETDGERLMAAAVHGLLDGKNPATARAS